MEHSIARELAAAGKRSWQTPFRGTIWDNAKRFQLIGKAYEAMPPEQGGRFDISTARHLAGPLSALQNDSIRMVVVVKAVQTLGSMLADLWLHYIIEHDPRNTLVLFEDDPKARVYANTRLMDSILANPGIAPLVQHVDRHDVQKTYIKFPGMTLMVGGLNDGNVSSLSWPNVIVSEAWIHKSDGLLDKAIARTTQFERDCKILIESQAGNEGEDLDRIFKSCVTVPLTWECPFCHGRQEFEWSRERPAGFVPTAPLFAVPEQANAPKEGTYGGMSFDREKKFLKDDAWDIPGASQTAMWECFHCGGLIPDTPSMRRALMDTYRQDYPASRNVGFYWPKEACLSISFAKSCGNYLAAKYADERLGNRVPLMDWYKAERAQAWRSDYEVKIPVLMVDEYNPAEKWEREWRRRMIIDVQDRLSHFWYDIDAVAEDGASRQLACGTALSFDELAELQKKFAVPDQWTFVDSSYEFEQVKTECARRGHWGKPSGYSRPVWLGWVMLQGSRINRFTRSRIAADGQTERFADIVSAGDLYRVKVGNEIREVSHFLFSKLHCCDAAVRFRDGRGAPRDQYLPDDPAIPLESRHSQQIFAHYRTTERDKKTLRITEIWKPRKHMIPDHFWDTLSMRQAVNRIWEIGPEQKTQ